jgi:hypothetical protein
LARAAGPQADKAELMRYLAELAWAPHAMLHNPQLSWREIDATTVEVSAESPAGPARVRLIFENGDITRIEADDRPRVVRTPHCSDALAGTLQRLPRGGWLPHSDPGGRELGVGGSSVRILARQDNGIPDEVIATLGKIHALT